MAFTNVLRTVLARIVVALAAGSSLAALAEPAGSTPDLVFSVTEGVTYQATPKEIRDKFEPLAEVIGKALRGDVKGRTVVTPDPDSITAVMVRSMLRTGNVRTGDLKLLTTRYQDAVPFYLENGFATVGATAASGVVKQWTDKGGKVVLRSRGVPIKQVIASSRRTPEERERIH